MAVTHVTLHVTVLGETSGIWCDGCLLPSGIGVTVGFSGAYSVLGIRDLAACTACGRQIKGA